MGKLTAVYDNPATMCREAWADGKLVAHICFSLLVSKGFKGHPRMHMGLNCGDWKSGAIRGDAEAIARQPTNEQREGE